MSDDFVDSVRQHASSEQKEEKDSAKYIEARKTWWIEEVGKLFDDIRTWLDPLIQDGTIKFDTEDITLMEEWLGSYTIREAVIRLANKELRLRPIGSMILGSYGRVDLMGPTGQAIIVLDADKAQAESGYRPVALKWHIVKREGLRRSTFEFNEATFKALFTDLFGIVR
jgi:hypothetical protein